MCSISGAVNLRPRTHAPISARRLAKVLEAALERGRDSVGQYIDGAVMRSVTGPLHNWISGANVVLVNNRAEPTTEWQREKDKEQVQPYLTRHSGGRLVVVHNGTIANDKELAAELGLPAPVIDSQIIGPVLADGGPLSPANVVERLGRLVGSYALVVHDESTGITYLAANYKPLHTAVYDGVLYFASLPHHLPGDGELHSTVHKLEPYTVTVLEPEGVSYSLDLPVGDPADQNKVLVVASGGMDSTVVAAQQAALGREVTLLHVEYQARAQQREREAIDAIAERMGAELIVVQTDLFKNTIKASRLTETREDVEIADGVAGAELAHEWVPARNLILASIAVGIAEARGIGWIALGNNLEESGAYPDNEQEFIRALNVVMPNAVNVNRKVRFTQPVGNLMKHEIVALGMQVGAPLELAWSCYNGGEIHCGDCGPCFMRRTAFTMNGLTDTIPYQQ
ncbi:7-cyano-7-deazaguanine synthase [Arthrobacter sulfonylureivorans]|uniref:7-cyano-7-deazaguanine synthase n=1 Tax=Arthrobacter sulfonylureivorans TaxID=2486855 RepID=UPI0039E2DFA3